MQQFRDQAERFGARLETDDVTKVELAQDGGLHKVWVGDDLHEARTVILAMGAQHRKLGVPGELELAGRGVSYCATCDAAFFRGAPTIIVGGGDSAMEEAMFLSKFASTVSDRAPPRRVPRLQDHARAGARDPEHRVADAVRDRGARPPASENGSLGRRAAA